MKQKQGTPLEWGQDVMASMAAAAMELSQEERKKRGFAPQTVFGMWIEQLVNQTIEEQKNKQKKVETA